MTAPTTTAPPVTGHGYWVMAVAAMLTVASYESWLGWSDDTSTEQVLGLAATLSVIVAIVSYRLVDLGRATIAVAVVAGMLAVTFWADYAADLNGVEVVWEVPVAIFIGLGAAIGLSAVALLVWSSRRADWTPHLSAVLTGASYLGWLGWDQQRRPDGTGPYEAWQVVGLALTLAIATAIISWRSTDLTQPMVAIAVTTAVLTLAFSLDAATDKTHDANLWPIGAISLYGGSGTGLLIVSLIAWALSRWAHPRLTS